MSRGDRARARLAVAAFAAWLAIVAAVTLVANRYVWFSRDDWRFLHSAVEHGAWPLEAYNGHWTTLSSALYAGLYRVFGLDSYLPYLGAVVAIWIGIAVALRAILRRSGTGPWSATLLAGIGFALCPVLMHQLSQSLLAAALGLGLLQVLLLDRDGPWGGREWLALFLGGAALMVAGSGVAVLVAVGLYALLRRGIAVAAGLMLPLLVVFAVWWWYFGRSSPFLPPPWDLRPLAAWLWAAARSPFAVLGAGTLVGWLLGAVVVVGYPVAWWRARAEGTSVRLLPSACLLLCGLLLALSSYAARWLMGPQTPFEPRNAALTLLCVLPAFAVATQELVHRHRLAALIVCVPLLAVALRLATGWTETSDQQALRAQNRTDVAAALQVAAGDGTPDWVQPYPGSIGVGMDTVTIGFLRTAVSEGRLDVSGWPTTPAALDQARARMGLARAGAPDPRQPCRSVRGPLAFRPRVGDRFAYVVDPFAPRPPAEVAVDTPRRSGTPAAIEGSTLLISTTSDRRYVVRSTVPGSPFTFCRLP